MEHSSLESSIHRRPNMHSSSIIRINEACHNKSTRQKRYLTAQSLLVVYTHCNLLHNRKYLDHATSYFFHPVASICFIMLKATDNIRWSYPFCVALQFPMLGRVLRYCLIEGLTLDRQGSKANPGGILWIILGKNRHSL